MQRKIPVKEFDRKLSKLELQTFGLKDRFDRVLLKFGGLCKQ